MRHVVGPDVNRALRAHDRQAEVRLLEAGVANAREVSDRTVRQTEHRIDRVARNQPDTLRPLCRVRPRDRSAALRDACLAPLRCAPDVNHHVEDVAAEHEEILTAAPRILLAATAEFEHGADPPVLDEVASRRIGG